MRRLRWFITIIISIFLVTGCGFGTETSRERIVTDGLGMQVHLPAEPQRIICLDIATSEIAMLVMPPDKIAGVSYFMDDPGVCNLYEQAKQINGRVERNIENILKLNPDMVLVTTPGKDEVREQLITMGIPVFTVKRPQTMEDISQNMKLIGEALQAQKEMTKLITAMRRDMQQLQKEVAPRAQKHKVRVLRISMNGPAGGKGTVIGTIIEEAGCINVASELGLKEGVLAHELVVTSGAEIFLMPTWDFQGVHNIHLFREEYENDPSLQTVPAVKNKNFVYIPDNYIVSLTPYRFFAIAELARAAYGVEWDSELEKLLPPGTVHRLELHKPITFNSEEYGDNL